MAEVRIGFIGAGQMAEAIARGIILARLVRPDEILASDPAPARREVFHGFGARVTQDNALVAREAERLVIAVKPQNAPEVIKEIGGLLTERHLLMTICAGCETGLFEKGTKAPLRVVRAMPNLPMTVGMGATALCRGRNARAEDVEFAAKVFGSAGKVVMVEERLIDAVTAVSGSGPAYFFFLAEAMIEAGAALGLSRETARQLTVQTARGAAEMLSLQEVPPEELRRRVTSKGGTTEAAFKVIEEAGVRETLVKALAAAARRAQELNRS